MSRIGLTILIGLSSLLALAESNDGIIWLNKEYNLGLIEEKEGVVNGSFQLVNFSKSTIRIDDVIPACGCTTVTYPKDLISRGDTAVIDFNFDPFRRPGKIEKNLKVYINGEKEPHRLSITGIVAASEETLQERYPIDTGELRLSNDRIYAGDVGLGGRRYVYVNVYNNSTDSVSVIWTPKTECLSIKMEPDNIAPKEAGLITIKVDTRKTETVGLYDFVVRGSVNSDSTDFFDLHIGINILPSR